MKIIKFLSFVVFFTVLNLNKIYASDFESWKIEFKKYALEQGISQKTLTEVIDNSRFLPDVIKYDRYQPEFYEDTKTYVSKRTSSKKISSGKKLFNSLTI